MTPAEYLAGIEKNAQLAAQRMHETTGAEARFDLASVQWLEKEIGEVAERLARVPDEREANIGRSVYGAFFGECFVRSFDGVWVYVDSSWFGVRIDRIDLTVNPWNKVTSALAGEEGESVVGFFSHVAQKYAGTAG
jgi:hypothetical protein